MHSDRYRRVGQFIALMVWVGLVLAPVAPSYAYHTDEEKITDDTAYTLRYDEYRLGIWKLEYGLFESLDLHTYSLPWLIGAANAGFKWQYDWNPTISFAVRMHTLKIDLAKFGGDDGTEGGPDGTTQEQDRPEAKFWILPFELLYSHRLDEAMTLSAGWLYNRVIVAGGADAGADVNGAAAISTGQLTATLQYNTSRSFALIAHARALAYQDLSAQGSFERTETVPPDITVRFVGTADTESDAASVDNAYSVMFSGQYSWNSLNIRFGMGHGNWSIPVVNLVLPEKTPIVEADIYWRF